MCAISQINAQHDIHFLLKHFGNTNMIVSLELMKQISRQGIRKGVEAGRELRKRVACFMPRQRNI